VGSSEVVTCYCESDGQVTDCLRLVAYSFRANDLLRKLQVLGHRIDYAFVLIGLELRTNETEAIFFKDHYIVQ